jgi:hypothetical protein
MVKQGQDNSDIEQVSITTCAICAWRLPQRTKEDEVFIEACVSLDQLSVAHRFPTAQPRLRVVAS